MGYGKRYAGTFWTRMGTKWTAEIWQNGYTGNTGVLDFPAEEPLSIEWDEKGMDEPICGSSATMVVISPGDRTYIDLYTIKAGEIRLDVLRNDALYWSGTLDTEFYEEPYNATKNYEVSLTFTDFGILERLKYNLKGVQSIDSVLSDGLTRSGINFTHCNNYCRANASMGEALNTTTVQECTTCGADTHLISTQWSEMTDGMRYTIDLSKIGIMSENWTDEEGEVMNMADVINGMLTPLGLKMIQRSGKIYIYDMNALAKSTATRRAEWASDDQTLGTGKVCNTVKITFSPYATSELSITNIKLIKYTAGADYYHILQTGTDQEYMTKCALGWRQTVNVSKAETEEPTRGFTLHWNGTDAGVTYGLGATINEQGAKYFHIKPWNSGEACDGIAALVSGVYFNYVGPASYLHTKVNILPHVDASHYYVNAFRIMTTATTVTDAFAGRDTAALYTITGIRMDVCKTMTEYRMKMPMLMDVRYNPFEEANSELGLKDAVDWVRHHVNWVYVPIRMTLAGDDGHTYTYSNWKNANYATDYPTSAMKGYWVKDGGVTGWDQAYLSYYSYDDRWDDTGVLGWQENKHTIPRTREKLSSNITNRDTGEYIPSPPVGGVLTIEVGDRLIAMNDTDKLTEQNNDAEWKWLLYKTPTVELVDMITNDAVKQDDVTYKGVINSDAKDDMDIDTNCGTLEEDAPLARGCYCDMRNMNAQLHTMVRGTRDTQVENLLIGSIYSQCGERKMRLSGTVGTSGKDIVRRKANQELYSAESGIGLITEASAPGMKFHIASAAENCIEDTADISMVEVSEDEYTDGQDVVTG